MSLLCLYIQVTLWINDPPNNAIKAFSERASAGDVIYTLTAYDDADDYVFSIDAQV